MSGRWEGSGSSGPSTRLQVTGQCANEGAQHEVAARERPKRRTAPVVGRPGPHRRGMGVRRKTYFSIVCSTDLRFTGGWTGGGGGATQGCGAQL
jgi:hypothetical protein